MDKIYKVADKVIGTCEQCLEEILEGQKHHRDMKEDKLIHEDCLDEYCDEVWNNLCRFDKVDKLEIVKCDSNE